MSEAAAYASARDLAQEIDTFFATAAREKASRWPAEVQDSFIHQETRQPYRAVPLVDAYGLGRVYPIARLSHLIERVTDIRLQLSYLFYDMGLANRDYYDVINSHPDLRDSPRLTLQLMAIDQSLIGRSRIAWEKLMRFVYYLETGQDLQPSGNRSYKSKFFSWVESEPQWRFLAPYEAVVNKHDAQYRTGEFHKGSVLRPRILGRETPSTNDFLDLTNYMTNIIWPNILAIVAGEWPSAFTGLHLVPGKTGIIDPRYLRPDDHT